MKKHTSIVGQARFGIAWLLFGAFLLAGGCAKLQPVALPDETSLPPAQSGNWDELAAMRSDNWLYLLNTGQEALDWRLRLIDCASQSLDLQTFLWSDDSTGLTILRHLYDAAERGVRVRLLLDDTFTANHEEIILEIDGHPQIELRVYNPYTRRSGGMVYRTLLNLGEFSRVDHRMHNKVMVVDNRAAIVGGRNLADEYFGNHDTMNFRDFEVLTAGPALNLLSKEFDEYWNNDWSFPLSLIDQKKAAKDPVEFGAWLKQTAARGLEETSALRTDMLLLAAQRGIAGEIEVVADIPAPNDPALAEELPIQQTRKIISWLDSAQDELILISAYLIPTPELEQAVERAENRGVRVRILTNSLRSNNHTAAHSAYRKHIHRLLGHGAEIHEVRTFARDRSLYMKDPVEDKHLGLHAKVLIIDEDLTYIGSTNLDPRSLRLNTEMGLLIKSSEFNELVRRAAAIDLLPRNAWYLQIGDNSQPRWVGDDVILNSQPAESELQRIEDWFLSILPLEGEM
ncbi:MAG: phospholipase D family protein [Desulfocapsaceae bacterium]